MGAPVHAFLPPEWEKHQRVALSEAGMNRKESRQFLVGKTPVEKYAIKFGYNHVFLIDHNGLRGTAELLPTEKKDLYQVVIPLSREGGLN